MWYARFTAVVGLSVLLAFAQTGESMQTAYDISSVFSGPPQTGNGLRWWEYTDFDSTTYPRANDHNLRTGSDVVWKVVLPDCFDSLNVHFAYHDSSRGNSTLATGYALFVINANTHDTTELLQNSYDDHMGLWTTFRGGYWVTIGYGGGFEGPGSAYIRGTEVSSLHRAGTGGGWGIPLFDSLRLAAGDTLYFIFTHNNGGAAADSVYLEVQFIQKDRPTPAALDLHFVVASPAQACMGNTIGVGWSATDTLNDGRDPQLYLLDYFAYADNNPIGSGSSSSTTSSGSHIPSYSTLPLDPNQGYVDYTEKWVVRGVYGHPRYPSLNDCKDTSLVSDTVSFTVRLTAVPSPKILYGGTDYDHNTTISIASSSPTFQAIEAQGMGPTLSYEWNLDGSLVGTSQTLNITSLSIGTHSLSLKITNAPSNAASCDATITVTLDVTTALSAPKGQEVVLTQEGKRRFTVTVQQEGAYEALLLDLSGRELRRYPIQGYVPVTFEPELSAGLYLLRIQGQGLTYTKRLLLEP